MHKHEFILFAGLITAIVAGPIIVLTRPDNSEAPKPQTQTLGSTTEVQAEKPAVFEKTTHSLTDPSSPWVVVNKQRPLTPLDYAPADLVAIGSQRMRAEAAAKLNELIKAAAAENYVITPLSGYRSYTTQTSVYANEVATYGQAVADTQSARPGHSEHQTGWGMDLGGGGCGIEDCFGETREGQWVAANAHKFGFIIRYPENKEATTGIRHEPWHVRYVGVELAAEMNKQAVKTLEEFFGLPAAPDYN